MFRGCVGALGKKNIVCYYHEPIFSWFTFLLFRFIQKQIVIFPKTKHLIAKRATFERLSSMAKPFADHNDMKSPLIPIARAIVDRSVDRSEA